MDYILGIETSCDETAAAIVGSDRSICSNIVYSQLEQHRAYGGVVPEIAARAHLEHMEDVISRALAAAQLEFSQLSGIAATTGPGLIGGVIVGAMAGKAIAAVHDKPFFAVNHLEGHALTVRLTHETAYPYLLLLVSGGHCQFVLVRGLGHYETLGRSVDDALGEAFDKTAKMLGLGYPGGPAVERNAQQGDAARFTLPAPMKGREGCDFSFAGLKTAVRLEAENLLKTNQLDAQARADLCASFQRTACETVVDRTRHALKTAKQRESGITALVVAGGVAANQALRTALETCAKEAGLVLVAPPAKLCTDNAAMIAWAGMERLQAGLHDSLDAEPRARWPLAEVTAQG